MESALDMLSKKMTTPHDDTPLSAQEKLTCLQFTHSKTQPGEIAARAMKFPESADLWKALKSATIVSFCCLLLLLLRWISTGWILSSRSQGCMEIDDLYDLIRPPSNLLSTVCMVFSFYCWCCLAIQSRRILGLKLVFLPESYVSAGIACILTYIWSDPHSSITAFPTGISLHAALEELALRITLWLRLLGVPDYDTKVLWAYTAILFRWMFVALVSVLFLYLSESLQTLQYSILCKLLVGVFTDQQVLTSRQSSFSVWNHVWRAIDLLAIIGTVSLPCVVLFVHSKEAASYSFEFLQVILLVSMWMLVACLCWLLKGAQQDYLLAIIPTVVKTLIYPRTASQEADVDWKAMIRHQFSVRYQTLLQHGSKLAVFPLLVILLLTSSSLVISGRELYPFAYGGPMLPCHNVSLWKAHVATSCHRRHNVISVRLDPICWATREVCEHTEHFSKIKFWKKDAPNNYSFPTTSSELLAQTEVTNTTLVHSIRELHSLAVASRHDPVLRAALRGDDSCTKKKMIKLPIKLPNKKGERDDQDKCHQAQQAVRHTRETVLSLVLHPFITSRMILTWIDLLGLGLAWFWLGSLALRALFYARQLRELQQISHMVVWA
jgi:hypothetical protein